MASLKKPSRCTGCGSTRLYKVVVDWTVPNYEGWLCYDCTPNEDNANYPEDFIVFRKKRNRDICRECGAKRDEREFVKGKNLCLDCKSKLHEQYREENGERLKKYRREYWKERGPEARAQCVRDTIERSPEAFLRALHSEITRKCRHKQAKEGKRSFVSLIVDIDYNYLTKLWAEQEGKCAILGLPMEHKRHSMKSISIDRIDSSKGYTPGNVQLVCQCINRMKNTHSNEEVRTILDEYVQNRKNTRTNIHVAD